MNIDIVGRHCQVQDALKTYVQEKMDKLDKFSLKVELCHIVFKTEKVNQICEIILLGKNLRLTAIETTKAMQVSFDAAASNIQNQLRRYHDKIKDRSHEKIQLNPGPDSETDEELEDIGEDES